MTERPERPDVIRRLTEQGFEERTSSPENDEYRRIIYEEQLPRLRGRPSRQRRRFKGAKEATEHLKRFALENGADRVAIGRGNQDWVYSDVEVPYKYGVVLLKEMDYEKIKTAPGDPAGIECTRTYAVLGETTVRVGEEIRRLGHDAMIHHPRGDRNRQSDLMLVPHAISCGLGEHGRNGLMISYDFGPRVRLGMVSTDLELVVDPPQDRGVAKFCEFCTKCLSTCPTNALPTEMRTVRGVMKFTIDMNRCSQYFEKTDGCAICIRDCTFNQPTLEKTRRMMDRAASWYEVVKVHPGWPEGL